MTTIPAWAYDTMGPFYFNMARSLQGYHYQSFQYKNKKRKSGIVHCCKQLRRISMASARSLAAVSVLAAASKQATLPSSSSSSSSSTLHSLSSLRSKPRELSLRTIALKGAVKAQSNEAQVSPSPSPVGDAFSNVKHLLLPVIDRNPYLSEGTRQAAATTTSLANKYGADITVVVIDEEKRESSSEHETQVSNIRWHLSQGGFEEFKLLERLGEGKKATAVIGEVADELKMELVVMSMEAIHSKYIDANLLAEFIPCPVLLLPL